MRHDQGDQIAAHDHEGRSTYDGLLARLGKHKTGKSCLYINKLADVDLAVLEELITTSVAWMREKYGC